MATRRETIVGAGAVLLGSGFLTDSAFTNGSTDPTADFRIVHPRNLVLVPGRDDHAHVTVASGDEYDHVKTIDITQASNRARTRFERIVEVVNNGETSIDELYFKLDVDSDTEDSAAIENALSIVSATATLPATGQTNYLEYAQASGDDPDVLEPGESVAFGIEIDLHGSGGSSLTSLPSPDSFDVALKLATEPAA